MTTQAISKNDASQNIKGRKVGKGASDFKIERCDCLAHMASLPDGSIDLLIADPPYGITGQPWDIPIDPESFWRECRRVVKKNGAILVFGTGKFGIEMAHSNLQDFRYDIIWKKSQKTGALNASRQPLRAHETIYVFYRKQPDYNKISTSGHARKVVKAVHRSKSTVDHSSIYGSVKEYHNYDQTTRLITSVIDAKKDTQTCSIHPTQKPVGLLCLLIKMYSNAGQTVYDPFMGSGSTGVAALLTGRKFVGSEKDRKMFGKAKNRISHAAREGKDISTRKTKKRFSKSEGKSKR